MTIPVAASTTDWSVSIGSSSATTLVRKRYFLSVFILKMPSFCQDRLGTNIGKTLKKEWRALAVQRHELGDELNLRYEGGGACHAAPRLNAECCWAWGGLSTSVR
jgi:hypothetical protein